MSKAGYTPVSDDDGADESSSIYNDKTQGGKVVEGMDVVEAMEGVGSSSGSTSADVVIADCGELK